MSLNEYPVPECLIRCDLNEILNTKRCFMDIQKKKENGREEFKELHIEAVSER